MLGKQAKVLALLDVADLLAFADCSRQPLRNRVMVLLSTKAGLRAGEIANLTWDMVLDASGQISKAIELRDHAAKKGSGRLIPMQWIPFRVFGRLRPGGRNTSFNQNEVAQ